MGKGRGYTYVLAIQPASDDRSNELRYNISGAQFLNTILHLRIGNLKGWHQKDIRARSVMKTNR